MTTMSSNREKKIRVLIVDDSTFMRLALRNVLAHDPEIEVVGTATDGADGVAQAAALHPDLITMDVEMPHMDGITAVRRIMATAPTRILMVSTLTSAGAAATFEALEAGAVDYLTKNASDSPGPQGQFRSELLRKVKETARAGLGRPSPAAPPLLLAPPQERVRSTLLARRIRHIGIGASTGGPTAVQEVLSRLPAGFPHAIIVAIHMPMAFTGPYAQRLNSKCPLSVMEAADGDLMQPGRVLVAPGGMHATLVREGGEIAVRLSPPSAHPGAIYVPSVDLMLTSLAEAATDPVLGVILTGMGNDGLKGMQCVKSKGGTTLVQDETTATVFGMPRACIEKGVADEILPLTQIGPAIGQIPAG